MYDELLMPLLLNGKALLALVDTGSNITLLHKSVIGDSEAPGHGLPLSLIHI